MMFVQQFTSKSIQIDGEFMSCHDVQEFNVVVDVDVDVDLDPIAQHEDGSVLLGT